MRITDSPSHRGGTSKGRHHDVEVHGSGVADIQAFTLDTDHVFPRHAHDEVGIGLVTSGAQRSWSSIGWVEARAGDVIAVNPGEMHDGLPLGGPRRWQMVYVRASRVAALLREQGLGVPTIVQPAIQDRRLAHRFERLFRRIRLTGASIEGEPLAVETEMVLTIEHLLRWHGDRPGLADPGSPAIARARQRIEDAPTDPATLADLAALARISRFQLLRGFAREVGTTPHAYLVQRRVTLARRLLDEGRSPADAAADAGFADQSHLTRAFRRQFGLTPARYRASRG